MIRGNQRVHIVLNSQFNRFLVTYKVRLAVHNVKALLTQYESNKLQPRFKVFFKNSSHSPYDIFRPRLRLRNQTSVEIPGVPKKKVTDLIKASVKN